MHAAKPKSRLREIERAWEQRRRDINGRRTKSLLSSPTSLPRAVEANAPSTEVVMRATIPTAVVVFRDTYATT